MTFSPTEYQKTEIDNVNRKLAKSDASIAFTSAIALAAGVGACLASGQPQVVLGCATLASATVLMGMDIVRSFRQQDLRGLENDFIKDRSYKKSIDSLNSLNKIDEKSRKSADYKAIILTLGTCFGGVALQAVAPSIGLFTALSAAAVASVITSTVLLSSMIKRGSDAREKRSGLVNNLLIRRQKFAPEEVALSSVRVEISDTSDFTVAKGNKNIKI